MKDVLLLICVLVAFYLGHFPIRCLDRFLAKNAENIEKRSVPDEMPLDERSGPAQAAKPAGWIEELTHLWYIKASKAKGR